MLPSLRADSKSSSNDEVAAARSGRSESRASSSAAPKRQSESGGRIESRASSAAPKRQLESGGCPSSESGRQQRTRTPSGILSVPSEIGGSSHPSTKKMKTKKKKGASDDLMEDYAQLQKDAYTYRQASRISIESFQQFLLVLHWSATCSSGPSRILLP